MSETHDNGDKKSLFDIKYNIPPKPKRIHPMACLRCERDFLSWSKAKNRLCERCQDGSIYISNSKTI